MTPLYSRCLLVNFLHSLNVCMPASVSDLLMKSCCKQILFWFYFFFISLVYCVTISFIGFSFSSDSSLLLQVRHQNFLLLLLTLCSFSQWHHLNCRSVVPDTHIIIRNQTQENSITPPAQPFPTCGGCELLARWFFFSFLPDPRSGRATGNVDIPAQLYQFLSETGNFCCL